MGLSSLTGKDRIYSQLLCAAQLASVYKLFPLLFHFSVESAKDGSKKEEVLSTK